MKIKLSADTARQELFIERQISIPGHCAPPKEKVLRIGGRWIPTEVYQVIDASSFWEVGNCIFRVPSSAQV